MNIYEFMAANEVSTVTLVTIPFMALIIIKAMNPPKIVNKVVGHNILTHTNAIKHEYAKDRPVPPKQPQPTSPRDEYL